MTEQHTLLWESGPSAAPLPPLVDLLGAGIAEVQLMVTMAILLSNYTLQFDPPDYQLVIEEHPTPVPGNHFQVKVVQRRTPSTSEERR